MHRILALTAVLSCTLMFSLTAQHSVDIPEGTAPTLDGTIQAQEWEDAFVVPLSQEATLFLKHTEGMLYLAVRAQTMGVPSPMVYRGEAISVLHASAALGTAIYAPTEASWSLQQPFTWRCRSTGFSPAAVAEREQFLEEEGWLGTIGYLGARTEFEYQISVEEEPVLLFFLFMEATTPAQMLSWPASEDSATVYLPLITGPIPEGIFVEFSQWALLDLQPN